MATIAPAPRISERPSIQATHVAAASGHYLATEAAMRILRSGGNAIDAGVAAGICIDVLLPDLCNFGGVAPTIVFHKESGDLVSISGLGNWGRSTDRERFVIEEDGDIPIGVKRSIVPGAPDAWLTALARYGKLTFAEVVQPAIELADGGFVVYPSLERNLAQAAGNLAQWPSSADVFLVDGNVRKAGSVFKQPDLANTFRRMVRAEEQAGGGRAAGVEAARDAFYRGDIGREIAAYVQQHGGTVDENDLADFHSTIETPPHVTFEGVDVHVCGPWCQGPVLAEALNLVGGFDLREMGHNSPDYIHAVAESLNLAFADREQYYGDPAIVDVPLTMLLSNEYAAKRRSTIDPSNAFGRMPLPGAERSDSATTRARPATIEAGFEQDTSYVCVVDEEGNAFSATPSDGVGSTPIIPGLGLICSGRGSQSWLEADHPSSVAPGKRPRLTPNPAMAFRDGKLFMPFGTPGGDMQCQSMLQTFLNVVVFNMDVQQAIEAPRFGTFSYPNSFWPHEYLPGVLRLESRIAKGTGEDLSDRGHTVEWWPEWTRQTGNMCAIVADHDEATLTAGADARAEAYASGW